MKVKRGIKTLKTQHGPSSLARKVSNEETAQFSCKSAENSLLLLSYLSAGLYITQLFWKPLHINLEPLINRYLSETLGAMES